MRRLMLVMLGLVLLALGGGGHEHARADDLQSFVQASRAKVKTFAQGLQGALQAAIKEGGPSNAIEVCNVEAPEIAGELSADPDWTVARTSHKLRNPGNAADRWEVAVLDEFLARAAGGEDLKTMEKAELVMSGGARSYRYMKAIPVGEVCLTCHGAEIDAGLQAQIKAFYPEDRATGFSLGELRGAFTITKAVPD